MSLFKADRCKTTHGSLRSTTAGGNSNGGASMRGMPPSLFAFHHKRTTHFIHNVAIIKALQPGWTSARMRCFRPVLTSVSSGSVAHGHRGPVSQTRPALLLMSQRDTEAQVPAGHHSLDRLCPAHCSPGSHSIILSFFFIFFFHFVTPRAQ